MRLAKWIFVGFAASSAAASPAPPSAEDGVKPPTWLNQISEHDVWAIYPQGAYGRQVSGEVELECTISIRGELRACVVVSEQPTGEGFANAAITLTHQALMNPATKNGAPIEFRKRFTLKFGSGAGKKMSRVKLHNPHGDRATDRVLSELAWLQAPTLAEVQGAYPSQARSQKLGGHVVVECTITASGRLDLCEARKIDHDGLGFRPAAESLARRFVAPLTDPAGQSLINQHAQVRITFDPATLDADNPILGRPAWIATATPDDFDKAFTEPARKLGATKVRVVLRCTIVGGGALGSCRVEDEDPKGHGFGALAVGLSARFRMSLWSDEGLPTVGGVIQIPLRYELDDPVPPPPPKP